MRLMTVEGSLQWPQARRAAQLALYHCNQLVPVAETLAEFVGIVLLDHFVEGAAWEPLLKFLEKSLF